MNAAAAAPASLSIVLHVLLFAVGGWLWVRPVTYGVTAGESAIEVELVAAPAAVVSPTLEPPSLEAAPETPRILTPEPVFEPKEIHPSEEPEDAVREVVQKPEPPKSAPAPGRDVVTQRASAGAQTVARPNYLRNPAPRYPEASRKNNEEGLVLLNVDVNASGRPTSVLLHASSGYERLDRAATEAVRRWIFEPAKLGPLPVASFVKVPVRFRLSDS